MANSVEPVLFVGRQAVGKSTSYRGCFFATHVRLGLDMLKARHREPRPLQACVEARHPFVVDNTHPDRSGRKVYIQAAQEAHSHAIGHHFRPRVEGCLRRNQGRPEAQRVPTRGILGTVGRMEFPSFDEALDEIHHVRIEAASGFVVEAWRDED